MPCLMCSLNHTDFYRFYLSFLGGDMNHFVGVGIFWINLDRTDVDCWRLTLIHRDSHTRQRAQF